MAAPKFVLKLCKPDGTDVVFPAGYTQEADLIEAIVQATVAKGVGVFRSEAAVADAIRRGAAEAFYAVKADSRKLL